MITGVSEERFVGAIGYPNEVLVEMPETVTAGEPFTVTIRTFGADGCWSGDGADVNVRGLTGTITPYDVHRSGRGVYCTMAEVHLSHSVELSFAAPGAAELAIHGRDGTATRSVLVQ
jgi:hypothetical protein